GRDFETADAGAPVAIAYRAVAAEPAVSSNRATLFRMASSGQRSGIDDLSPAQRFHWIAVCAAERHQPAGANLVRAGQRTTRAVPPFRTVEPGFPARASELSIAHRAACRRAQAGRGVVGAVRRVCAAVFGGGVAGAERYGAQHHGGTGAARTRCGAQAAREAGVAPPLRAGAPA